MAFHDFTMTSITGEAVSLDRFAGSSVWWSTSPAVEAPPRSTQVCVPCTTTPPT